MSTFTPMLAASLGDSLNPFASHLMQSGIFLRWVNLICLIGLPIALWSAIAHARAARRSALDPTASVPDDELLPGRVLRLALLVGMFTSFASVGYRWVEVNHFPSQTMSEVLVMFSTALLVSMAVLQPALGLRRSHGHAWATVDDTLVALVFVGTWMTNHYSTSLSTAQRDLPPALQSYWFAPHLTSLIFSYATLAIAALIATVFFALRFWVMLRSTRLGSTAVGQGLVWAVLVGVGVMLFGIRSGAEWVPNPNLFWIVLALGVAAAIVMGVRAKAGRKVAAALILTVAWMAFLPFGHFVTLPVLAIVGIVTTVMHRRGSFPTAARVTSLEMTLDEVSFKAFAVGFPFLTAGLFMGAFWAQEAWANYWGWDSKENTALISWLIYVLYVHVRLLGGYRGAKSMGVLVAGALSIFITFQIFGYLPDSQKSMHRYTDDGVVPREGMQGSAPTTSARVESNESSGEAPTQAPTASER
ncbi:Cytochrome c biogenesis protein CcsA [Planctomycetes bacterium Pla163]|uniref:Cytochrome c biogenesis protein CcsA n=1 Tax=Rohdeia mirabilis TaxID=2528008 RepID=A0A518CZV7_9BACT|nr:Cytochrome c biogenesis protein CcsA [Planctomycetes bacterium Pla163]